MDGFQFVAPDAKLGFEHGYEPLTRVGSFVVTPQDTLAENHVKIA